MKPVHVLSLLLSCLAALPSLVGPSLHAEVPAGQTQRLKSPDQAPVGLSPSDWAGIRGAYEAGQTEARVTRALASLTTSHIAQQSYLKASNTGELDYFGWSVAVSGDTVVVGAYLEGSDATGINGNQANNSARASGAAYVFTRTGTTWTQQAYLKASNTEGDDYFGHSVAVAGDTVVVGAPGEDSNATGVNGDQTDNSALQAGAAYVFTRVGTTWTQQAYLKASNGGEVDGFGSSVAVSGDTVVVGAPYEASNAIGINGNGGDNSAFQAGAAYVFTRNGKTWTQQAYLKASNTDAGDRFGYSAAVSGDTVGVGADLESSYATGVNGDQANNFSTQSGAVYVFTRSGTTWTQQTYLKASNTGGNDQFGWSVAVSDNTMVVGARNEDSNGFNGNQDNNSARDSGAAYVFKRSGTTWTQKAYLKASNARASDYFGTSVAVSGGTIVVGAYGEDSNATGVNGGQADSSAMDSGGAYIFVDSGTTWTQRAYVKASNTGAGDWFGYSVAISGETVIVGAYGEDSKATGVDGDGVDNSTANAGAAYIIAVSGSVAEFTVEQSGKDFLLSFLGEPGLSYRVQYASNSSAPVVWNEFAPPAIYTAAPDGAVAHRDVNPTDPHRIYRAVVSP